MSRKMIDYQVENGKIKSIDGYNVGGGGDELHFKTISGEKTIYHNPDDANELSQLSNGTWLKQVSRSFPLTEMFSAKDVELIKKAKAYVIVPVVGISVYGDDQSGIIAVQATNAPGHPESQGYKIKDYDGVLNLSAIYVASVLKAANTTKYTRFAINIACDIFLVY